VTNWYHREAHTYPCHDCTDDNVKRLFEIDIIEYKLCKIFGHDEALQTSNISSDHKCTTVWNMIIYTHGDDVHRFQRNFFQHIVKMFWKYNVIIDTHEKILILVHGSLHRLERFHVIGQELDRHMWCNSLLQPSNKRMVLVPVSVPHESKMLVNLSGFQVFFQRVAAFWYSVLDKTVHHKELKT